MTASLLALATSAQAAAVNATSDASSDYASDAASSSFDEHGVSASHKALLLFLFIGAPAMVGMGYAWMHSQAQRARLAETVQSVRQHFTFRPRRQGVPGVDETALLELSGPNRDNPTP